MRRSLLGELHTNNTSAQSVPFSQQHLRREDDDNDEDDDDEQED